jgi:hypothetical protein
MNMNLRMFFLGFSIFAVSGVVQAENHVPMAVTDNDYYPAPR